MDILLVVLRLVHIVAAVAWLGFSAVTALFIAPAAVAAGDTGLRYLKTLFTHTNLGSIIGVAAGLTMLAGILLYLVSSSASHFSSTGNIVLGIGAVAGILAGVYGGAVTQRATRALGEALNQHIPDGSQPIPAEALPTLNALAANLVSHSRISLILMIIALLGMGSARYL